MKAIDLTGKIFGKLRVVRRLDKTETTRREAMFECLCSCGKRGKVSGNKLRSGRSQCNGCYRNRPTTDAAVVNDILSKYRGQAEKRGFTFLLSREDFCTLLFSSCFYCGCEPSDAVRPNFSRVGRERTYGLGYNGIDRLDNGVGYISSNCVTCCFVCNRAKNDLSYDEFVNWVARVYRMTLHGRNNQTIVCGG